jgi:hypothetical protein
LQRSFHEKLLLPPLKLLLVHMGWNIFYLPGSNALYSLHEVQAMREAEAAEAQADRTQLK